MRIVRGLEEARKLLLRHAPGAPADLPSTVRQEIRRVFGEELDVETVVRRILRDVREEGDAAVLRYNQDIDGVGWDLEDWSLEISHEEKVRALSRVEPSLLKALKRAAERIREFHLLQMEHSLRGFRKDGLGQVVRPLERVGLYIPGTEAVYPSTVLMTAIPAKVAGVREVVMTTPASPDGEISPLKLAAADMAGVDRVFRAGGVQGIAALAYGTETVPRVDKICGPGNVFVTEAKRQVYGTVGIDGLFGPSETVVIADGEADAAMVAADLLAGAEHDELAAAVLITTSQELASAALGQLQAQLDALRRAEVARVSLEARGGIAVVESLREAVDLANEFAPEHLCLHVQGAERLLDEVLNAGCVFLGGASAESIGDYTAGPSHVMPTGGSARFASPLGVQDFLKVMSVVGLDAGTAREIGEPAAVIAWAEGLTGHALAIERRLRTGD